MNEELNLEQLKERSRKAFSSIVLIILLSLLSLMVVSFYFSNLNSKKASQFMQSYKQVLNNNADTDLKKYVATTIGNCMENKLYKTSGQNIVFISFNYVQFQKDMTDVKNQCLTAISDDAELRHSRGGHAINQDAAFEHKIRTLLKDQSL